MKTYYLYLGTLLLCLLGSSEAMAGGSAKSLCSVHYPSDDAIEWQCVQVKPNDSPAKLFGDYWQDVLRFNRVDRRHFVAGTLIKVPKRLEVIKGFTPMPAMFYAAVQEPKFILVDQSEMFLGAYEYGRLVFSAPATTGVAGHRLPNGQFKIDAIDRLHQSDTYTMEGTTDSYPMNYAMRFLVDHLYWISYWIHGRDLPGYPASHGCVGLYDEEMQNLYYEAPTPPILMDAKKLFDWVVGQNEDNGEFHRIDGPKLVIFGTPPR